MKPLETGVSQELANWRKSVISDLHYALSFDIPEEESQRIAGQLVLTCQLSDTQRGLILDFKEDEEHLISLQVNGQASTLDFQADHIRIDPTLLIIGENRIEIAFTAGDLSLNRNAEYLYTLLVPDRARTVFPVFDQPDLKASWSLNLTIPKSWTAVANGALISQDSVGGRRHIKFARTRPISTYLFAFAAGKFRSMTDESSGMTMYYRETDDEKVAANAPAIFELHRSSLAWLEAYTEIDFPFGKFDFALIPGFQYGGMEHPGAIWYRESSLFLESSATINQQLRRASLIAHETAHMWFGNLVTMTWFSDVWLKEVFANLMAAKIVNPSFPEINHDLNFLLDHYPSAYAVDRTKGTHPIQQELPNLEQAGTLYGAIIYEKAPIVMRNLESMIGETAFQTGIQRYLREFSYGNATWDDLITILDQQTEGDLTQWDQDWVKRGGMPEMAIGVAEAEIKPTGQLVISNSTGGQYWPQSVNLLLSEHAEDNLTLEISGSRNSFPIPKAITEGAHMLTNIDGRTYGHIQVDSATQIAMLEIAASFPDPEGRASMWLGLWESMLRQEMKPEKLLAHCIASIESEDNPLILSYLLGRISRLFWQFIPPTSRDRFALEIEGALIRRLRSEPDLSIKRNLYESLIRLAWTKDGKQTILEIWQGNWENFDLPLSENDYVNLAFEMAIRDMTAAPKILRETLQKLNNPDRRARMEFILPAVSADEATRDTFFKGLELLENRSHEPWVGTALFYLHHPLRASHSIQYLPKSLEMIQEIQETGDIFFPANWLTQTLGSYQSPEAASIIREFLHNHPGLSPNLQNKVLQAADPVFRAAEIRSNSKR